MSFKKGKKIGSGATSTVYFGELDNKEVAAKFFYDEDDLEYLEEEYKILGKLQHIDGVVKMISRAPIAIFFERYSEYNLGDKIRQARMDKKYKAGVPFLLSEALPMMWRMLNIIDRIHALNILHNDLKPSNILLNSDGEVVVADFGHSREYSDAEMEKFQRLKELYQTGLDIRYLKEMKVGAKRGTECYGPPENAMRKYTCIANYPISDIWNLGQIFFEMLTGFCLSRHRFHMSGENTFEVINALKYGDGWRKMIDSLTDDMNVEGFEIYSKNWKSYITEERSSLSILTVAKGFQAAAGEDITGSSEKAANLNNLLRGMLDPNPLTRLSAKECLENPLFDKLRYSYRR